MDQDRRGFFVVLGGSRGDLEELEGSDNVQYFGCKVARNDERHLLLSD